MLIAKDLALKVLGGLAVGGTVIGGGIAISRYNKEDHGLKELKEKGLECGDDYCTLAENKTLTVKHDDNTTRELTAIPKEAVGKIRIHRQRGGNNKFSFSIEGGDIAPTWAATDDEGAGDVQGSSITKLEEFETYEIEEGTSVEGQPKKYFFRRKTKAADEIKKLLGLESCDFPTGDNDSTKTCTLDEAKLKAINFEEKKGEPTIAESGTSANLTISWVSDFEKETDTSNYSFRYLFELSGDKEINIPTSSKPITKKTDIPLEFKIKRSGSNLTLEKVSQLEKLSSKLGFTECKGEGETRTCKFPEKINVYKGTDNSVKEAAVTDHANKTITFEEDVAGYSGGVKFSLSSAVAITGGTSKGSAIENIETGNYEIKQQTVDTDSTT